MIIGVVGFIGSGKGTVGEILVNEHGFKQIAFADALKDAVSDMFQWSRHMLEGDTPESREWREEVDSWWSDRLGYDVTPRSILQRMGTEVCRHGLADNIWILALERRLEKGKDYVITDVRFPNEIEFVRSVGGVVVRVKRGDDPSFEERSKMHISETAWFNIVPDVTIENNGTISDLEQCVRTILTAIEKSNTI